MWDVWGKLSAVREVIAALKDRPLSRDKVIDATEKALRAFDASLAADKLDQLQAFLNDGKLDGVVSIIGGGVAAALEQFGLGRYSRFVDLQTQAIAELMIAVSNGQLLVGSGGDPLSLRLAELETLLPPESPLVGNAEPVEISPIQVIGLIVSLIRLWRDLRNK